jgi:hypothetical protein
MPRYVAAGNTVVSPMHRQAITMEEIERRGAEIASGKVKSVSGAAVLRRIRQVRKEINGKS